MVRSSLKYIANILSQSRDPTVLFEAVNRFIYNHFGTWDYNERGVLIMEEDWDNLIILDACRYDAFCEAQDIASEVEKRESVASETTRFLKFNFSGQDLRDTVYVTANPNIARHWDDIDTRFYEIDNLWRTKWDDEQGTVSPETVTEVAIQRHDQFPNKRLIVHYLQPHAPFIGSEQFMRLAKGNSESSVTVPWPELPESHIDVSAADLWEAYMDTLEVTLPYVEQLLSHFQGKTVVTADHGNMFGEREWPIPIRGWGHPPRIYTKELIEIPWLVHNSGTRKMIERGQSNDELKREVQTTAMDRLVALGYRE